jgi:hypothetical protein
VLIDLPSPHPARLSLSHWGRPPVAGSRSVRL